MRCILYKKKDCPNCPIAEKILQEFGVEIEVKDVSTEDGYIDALMDNINSAPAVKIDGNIHQGVAGLREFLERMKKCHT